MRILLLRLDAPLMSFGGSAVDHHGVIRPWPARSMVVGLLANALGWRREEAHRHGRLQERVRLSVRCDAEPEPLRDFQTVGLSQSHLIDTGWTTDGVVAERQGGSASTGTHIRLRDYWVDGIYTLALGLDPENEEPSIDHLREALDRPARPLFFGRKSCLPSGRIALGIVEAASPLASIRSRATCPQVRSRGGVEGLLRFWWDDGDVGAIGIEAQLDCVTDERDWANQVHVGERRIHFARLAMRDESDA